MIRAGVALVAALGLLGAGGAAAEHAIEYRYVVLGYVKDARGKPLPGRTVELVRDKTGFAYRTQTDHEGFYVVIVRLGDESSGESLTVRVDRLAGRIIARFDPRNHTDERGTRVDLEGTAFVERPSSFRSTLGRFVGTPAQ